MTPLVAQMYPKQNFCTLKTFCLFRGRPPCYEYEMRMPQGTAVRAVVVALTYNNHTLLALHVDLLLESAGEKLSTFVDRHNSADEHLETILFGPLHTRKNRPGITAPCQRLPEAVGSCVVHRT